MRQKLDNPDHRIAVVAARQHGVVSLRQLHAAGMSSDRIKREVRAGRLVRVYRGVYAVGHAGLSTEGRWMAAVLACGEGAVLSHRSAAELWRLIPVRDGPTHVTVPSGAGRSGRSGISLHRSPSMPKSATTRRHGIAVTTPARTIADLRRCVSAADLRRAIREAEALGLPLGDRIEKEPTRSELEHRFLRLCRRHHLPMPEVNARVGGYEVDFLWRDRRLIVELDGYRYHRGRIAFERDRERDVALKLLGYEVVRITYRQVREQPAQVVRALRALVR